MITYEVIATIPDEIADEYDAYMLKKHIGEVVAAGNFTSATYSKEGSRRRTIYEVADKQTLDRYLSADAERLRRDFAEHFPNDVAVTREVWDVVARFDAP